MNAKNGYRVLGTAFLIFFALGLPEGAFGIAWPLIREDMGFSLELVGVVLVGSAIAYALASALLGRLSAHLSLARIALLGAVILLPGLLVRAFVPGFAALALLIVLSGVGGGLVDASVNSYMAQSFSTRHLNWGHCFWGLGAAVGPILFAQMVLLSGWRLGYIAIGVFQAFVIAVLLISILKKVWKQEGAVSAGHTQPEQKSRWKAYLTERRHQFMQILICFLQGGAEYSMGFWTATVMMESRGLTPAGAGLFPAVFFGAVMAGRLVFGYLANRVGNQAIFRMGIGISLAGMALLTFTSHLFGMALVGLGLAPIFPCLIHDAARRFSPETVTRLVGFQVAAFSMGVAILSSVKGVVLAHISLEGLFPIVIGLLVAAFLLNERLEGIARKSVTA